MPSLRSLIKALPYYFPVKTREETKKVLGPYIETDGYFIIRDSSHPSTQSDYTFSLTYKRMIIHVKLVQELNNNQFSLEVENVKFPSIDDLVNYYKNNSIPNATYKDKDLKLLHPVFYKKSDMKIFDDYIINKIQRPTNLGGTPRTFRPLPPAPYASCSCGLDISKAQLTESWRVHLSHDVETDGMPFFENDENGDKLWELPQDIARKLSNSQKEFLLHINYQGQL